MEQITLGNRYKECRPRRSSNCQTKVLVGRDVFTELEERRSSPSVIAKLMGIDVLPPSNAAHNRHQEFKDVFEVSEEPQQGARKGRQHHLPKGLPNLKQSAMKLKRLMPSKVLYRDDTDDNILQFSGGLDHLNSVGISNPLFEKRPRDMNYSPNYQCEKDQAKACRKYPLGLADSSLSEFRNLLRGEVEDPNSIVLLEPGMEKGLDAENIFSIPYLSPVNKNRRKGTKHKQTVFPVVGNGHVQQHHFGNDDVVESRIGRERCFTSRSTDPLLKEQEASYDQFDTLDFHCSGSSKRCSTSNSNSRRNKKSSFMMRQQYEESASGSKTLAEMFALSDSERLKLNSDLYAENHNNKLDQKNGHSKEGCFIVLPKHALPLPLQSSMHKDACLEGSPKGRKNNLTSSISYNNGHFCLDSFQDQTRLLKQTGNNSKDNLRNTSNFNCLMADNFSSPDYLNEKVLFTTEEGMVQHHADSKASAFDVQLAGKQKATRLQFHCHEYESTSLSDHTDGAKSCKGLKEVEQPSPVSILEPLTDEDSSGYFKSDPQEMAKKRKDIHPLHDQAAMSSDDEDQCDYQSLEAFQVEEDRDFSYLLDILIGSGIIVADWQLLCKSWYSPGCSVGPHVFDRLERKYSKLSSWSKPERRLLFDLVNSSLSEFLEPCIDVHSWVPSRSQCALLWGPEGPVEKVWQTIVRQREEFATVHPDEMVLDSSWPDIRDDINMVGKHIARMLHGDLLEELIVEFLSGH